MTAKSANDILAAQHNVASRAQLLTVLTRGALNGFVRRGSFVARHRGVYHRNGVVLCEKGEAVAALLRSPEGSCVTGPLGLSLLGVDGFHGMTKFHVLVPPGIRLPRGVDFVCRTNESEAAPRLLGAIRLAAPARMLVDAARPEFGVTEDQLWRAYDYARWNTLLSTARFVRELTRSGPADLGAAGWWGIADERLLQLESPKEREVDPLLRRFDPVPEVQVYVTPSRRVDFFWRRFRLAIEYLGVRPHRNARGRRLDVVRGDELESVGVRTIPITKEDLDEPDALCAYLLQVACARAEELGVAPPVLG